MFELARRRKGGDESGGRRWKIERSEEGEGE